MKTRARNTETSTQPAVVTPMLSTLVRQPFTDDAYVFEVKWDGYRIIAHCNNSNVKLQSRGGEDYTKKYPSVVRALKAMNLNCILDGEVVYLNAEGKPDFDALQRINGQRAPVVYYAFDLLWLQGNNLMSLSLVERKDILRGIVPNNNSLKYSDHFDDGLMLFEQVKNMGLEGIIAKRTDSPYLPGDRSKKWLKITADKKQEFVIGGWVESEKRNTFRTLLFGAYENGRLNWKGHAGGGYKEKDMPRILKRLQEIEIDENPFDSDVDYSEGRPHWVKPELVANIKFATTTRSGKIRKPAIFLGFRDDKKAEEVVMETPQPPPDVDMSIAPAKSKVSVKVADGGPVVKQGHSTSPDSNWPVLESRTVTKSEKISVDDCEIEIHDPEREIWKGVTRAALIQYYNAVSDYILPHVRNRPLSLHVKHQGPNAPGLYIKDMEGRGPACAEIFSVPRKHPKPGKRDVIDYLVCNNRPTLLYTIDLGCIDLNPWTSSTTAPGHPDFIIVDLDPSDKDFKKAIESAMAAREILARHKLKAFPKTSGKTGIHIYLPCVGFSFAEARRIAEHLCGSIHGLVPEITTTEVTVSKRGEKLYLDPNQNDYADTVACPYSARPFKYPTVSTPFEWKELTSDFHPTAFTIQTILERLDRKGDMFAGTLDKTIAAANSKRLKRFL